LHVNSYRLAILAKAEGNDNIEYAHYLDTEQLRMHSRPHEVNALIGHLVNQQKIPTNLAFTVV